MLLAELGNSELGFLHWWPVNPTACASSSLKVFMWTRTASWSQGGGYKVYSEDKGLDSQILFPEWQSLSTLNEDFGGSQAAWKWIWLQSLKGRLASASSSLVRGSCPGPILALQTSSFVCSMEPGVPNGLQLNTFRLLTAFPPHSIGVCLHIFLLPEICFGRVNANSIMVSFSYYNYRFIERV